MAKRGGFLSAVNEFNRYTNAQLREVQRQQREIVRQQRERERALKALQKEQARQYTFSQTGYVDQLNKELRENVSRLSSLLNEALSRDPYIYIDHLKETLELPAFNPGKLALEEQAPKIEAYLPPAPSWLLGWLPSVKSRHESACENARQKFEAAKNIHAGREEQRLHQLNEARAAYDVEISELKAANAAQHAGIESFKSHFTQGEPTAVADYFSMILENSDYPEGFPKAAQIAYLPESKQLIVEYDLPELDIVPEVGAYKYVKTRDEITETARPLKQRKDLYASVIAQTALRTLHELFKADRFNHLETIAFNGYVETIDKGTGHDARICLVTLRTTRDVFCAMDLTKVEPLACLKKLNASVSKSPAELAPVRPVVEYKMTDPRFIEEDDVLSGLDQRANLMDLTPTEFESLITNLFEKMGLEARQTQASRDGGVDCVAYDPRPIFGGKVVIQAKRYKNTVGVSAVRDLYGTMQNEGASKGILVTTSGYGKAAFEFAEGKPIELLSGSNLLHLLAEHAGLDAKIEIPDTWKETQMDSA